MSKAKQVAVSMTDEQKKKAQELSVKILGKVNISGLINYLILKEEKDSKK